MLVLQDGCASDLSVVPGEETSGEETEGGVDAPYMATMGSLDTGTDQTDDTAGLLDTGTGEIEDTGIEPGCGNGIVEAGETCDEQGQTETCDEDCTPVDCGDGLVNEAAGEECDDGEVSEACNLDCTLPRCGDDVINVEGEECDDGEGSAVCDADCTLAVCGDGTLNGLAAEECDDGGESGACDVDCTPAVCGDEVFNATAGEQCDGAGRTAPCNDDCSLAACGDGITNVTAGEVCDDAGETVACNANCSLAACGDGITNVTAGEACDDVGETIGCDMDCTPAVCGDGLANLTAGEDCDGAGVSAGCDEDCTVVECGDVTLNVLAGEICEATDLAGGTCEGLGFGVGTLACDAACGGYETSGCTPSMPILNLSFSQVKRFEFSWAAAMGAEYYQVLESPTLGLPYMQLGGDVVGESVSFEMPLHFRWEATYVLRACNEAGCTESAAVDVMGSLVDAVGYIKASNTGAGDEFGNGRVALSGDGNTLAVGAHFEDSNATGIGGNQANNSASQSGAVYVFVRNGAGAWSQQAYVKASNTGTGDNFGISVALSENGNTLAVGANQEDSNATGIGGNQADNSSFNSGAVYVFVRDGAGAWSLQAYVKASNTGAGNFFGYGGVALSEDGNTLAVGAYGEDSNATGIGGNQADNSAFQYGAVYVFARDGAGAWSQQAYVKASNTGTNDLFGFRVALSGDGNTLAVGAYGEDSNATGIGGNQTDNSASDSGAVYVFVRDEVEAWSQQAYIKASNTGASDGFGNSVALSGDGSTLAVGAAGEDSNEMGIGGDQTDNSASSSGAVYIFVRDGAGAWSQQAYVKASNTGASDIFSDSMVLSGDGNTLAVGAPVEDSDETGIGGNQADDSASDAGAIYVFIRDGAGTWSQQAYVKASNTEASDLFGSNVALSGDGNTLAVGAYFEDSNATNIGGNQADDSFVNAGAVYLY